MFSLLFVDDDDGMRAFISRALAGRFRVDVASGGHEALELLSTCSHPYAVLIADRTMARGDGLQLLKAAGKLAPATARVLLSGDHRLALDDAIAREAELFRCLVKPIDLRTLFATAADALDWHIGASRALAA
jgi:DNA-binding NtrC family response regulator